MAKKEKGIKKNIDAEMEEIMEDLDPLALEEDELPIIEVEEAEEMIEEDDIIVEVEEQVRPSKLQSIRVKSYTRVYIGEWYTFEPNRVYRVEECVKAKLQNADLLLPV